MPLGVIITESTTADCTQASCLIEGIHAEPLLAGCGYNANAVFEQAEKQGMKPVIPPKKNRLIQRKYDENIYRSCHLIENAFFYLKRWCGITTRYAKKYCFLPHCRSHPLYRPLG